MKQTEVSAGGLIIRNHNNVWQILLIRDMNDNWTFPKGFIETGEQLEEAARREIQEEVGLNRGLLMMKQLSPITYTFRRKVEVHKTVYYFLFLYKGNEDVHGQTEEGISDVLWIPLNLANKKISYPKTNIVLLREVQNYIQTI